MATEPQAPTRDCLERFRELWQRGLRVPKRRLKVKSGSTLFEAGQPAQGIFFLLSGTVRLSLQTATKTIEIRLLRPGDFIGLLPTLSFREHPLTAVALEDVEVEAVTPQAFMKALTSQPQHWPLVLEMLCLDVEYAHQGLRQHIC